MRGATLFSGGGGVEVRLKECINFVAAVEYDATIADVYRANIGGHVVCADVRDVDYGAWGLLDYLHASPVCKNASSANADGEETDEDITTALAVVRAIGATSPRVFTLENVWGYRTFEAFRRICQTLDRHGYMWHFEHVNAADYGVPQTRRRLILRAVKDTLLPPLPMPEAWVGWYAAIEDLIPTLPESAFAPWQLERLPEKMGVYLLAGGNTSNTVAHRACQSPRWTLTSTRLDAMRAFIVDGQTNDHGGCVTLPQGDAPMYTLSATMEKRPARAWLVGDQAASRGTGVQTVGDGEPAFTVTTRASGGTTPRALLVNRAWLQHGRVVKMTPRALARFQSFPDWYELPARNSLACTVIGNAVPSLMMQKIVLPLLEIIKGG